MKINQSAIRSEAEKIDFDWQKFLTPDELNRMARLTGFTKRNGKQNKISGAVFMDLIVLNADILSGQSLGDLCINLRERNGIAITSQGLDERFNAAAVTFLKTILHRIIRNQLYKENMFSTKAFKRILIKDSTCFQISDKLAHKYKGCGGSGSKASMRIQFEYDLLNGEVTDLSLHAFTDQDATNSKTTLNKIQRDDLIIRDLAYMYGDVLEGIDDIDATYLCRLGQGVQVFEQNGSEYNELNFETLYQQMKACNQLQVEKTVYITEKKMPVRLFIYLLPQEVVSKRLRDKNATAKRKGRPQPTQKFRIRQHFNLVITNDLEENISLDCAYEIYRLRWQIELIFKTWKSLCAIDKVKPVKEHRLECYVFAKLIILMMGWRIFWAFNTVFYHKNNSMLSLFKFFKHFKHQLPKISKSISSGRIMLDGVMASINENVAFLKQNVKKEVGKMTLLNIIETFLCVQNQPQFNNRQQA